MTPDPLDLPEAPAMPDHVTAVPDTWGDPVPCHGLAGSVVYGYRIAGTRTWIFGAWEPSSPTGDHSTIRRIDGAWYGELPSSRAGLADLPTAEERLSRLDGLRRAAVLAVRAARPDVAALLDAGRGRISGGHIEVNLDEAP